MMLIHSINYTPPASKSKPDCDFINLLFLSRGLLRVHLRSYVGTLLPTRPIIALPDVACPVSLVSRLFGFWSALMFMTAIGLCSRSTDISFALMDYKMSTSSWVQM